MLKGSRRLADLIVNPDGTLSQTAALTEHAGRFCPPAPRPARRPRRPVLARGLSLGAEASLRCSMEILRNRPDGSSEFIQRYRFDDISSVQIREMADIELRASEAAHGANAVAVYDRHARKLFGWETTRRL